MGLPSPIPDNPLRWDGWKQYSSDNLYERLCLSFESNPGAAQIEDHCRQLMAWWQKKLPLKNQPSNPLSQLLRAGLDDAPAKLAEARSVLVDAEGRARVDAGLLAKAKEGALAEFNKFLAFVLTGGELAGDDEDSLYGLGENLGLTRPEMKNIIDEELDKWGMKRVIKAPPAPAGSSSTGTQSGYSSAAGGSPQSPAEEFLRMLRLSGIDEITDDQRDAFCNMGEALGLTGSDAEDLIDEYLEERMAGGIAEVRSSVLIQSPAKATPVLPAAGSQPPAPAFSNSPLTRAREKEAHPNFMNGLGQEMLLIPSGSFPMGSCDPGAAPNEKPVSKTNISAFYLARWPVTNAQYEQFDSGHKSKRAAGADDTHPVVHVSAMEASRFCDWLGMRERRKYRLPTEAEWEYAARGTEDRIFPWGNTFGGNDLANFADVNKNLPWADRSINCGFSATSPVGAFPRGASPFGLEDMAGNVWEWCLDCLAVYPGKERTNPRGPSDGSKRVYRGGSWKSRASSLRVSARNCNAAAFSSSDVGFRVLCELK